MKGDTILDTRKMLTLSSRFISPESLCAPLRFRASQQKLFAAVERDAQLVDPGVDEGPPERQECTVRFRLPSPPPRAFAFFPRAPPCSSLLEVRPS